MCYQQLNIQAPHCRTLVTCMRGNIYMRVVGIGMDH